MNAERLREIVDFLLKADNKNAIQERLNVLYATVNELVGNPADQTYQQKAAEALTTLEKAISTFAARLTPAEKRNIASISAHPYFGEALVSEISAAFARSGMTPAVLQTQLKTTVKDRQSFIDTLKGVQTNFETLGIKAQSLSPGEAEIGVLIPRDLFRNSLDGLQKELKTLNSIIRTFYEVSNVTPGAVEVRQISTSDPIFFLGMDITVLVHLGHTIKWCIDTIKATMDIKKIVQAARSASLDETVVEALEKQITAKVEKCIDEKVGEILGGYQGDTARKNELKNPLHTALDQILQRVERGMTVEIRLIPPPREKAIDDSATPSPEAAKFEELREIAKSLDFPQIPPGEPVMQLTQVDQTQSDASNGG